MVLLTLGACAKKEPPSGGPPDLEPPRIIASTPDSGVAGVARDIRPSLEFSEQMEPRTTGEAVSFAPPLEIRQRRWSGKTLTLVLAESLGVDRTYTLFIAGTANDRHGNPYGTGKTIVFSTAPTFPPGSITGKIEARGFVAAGTYVWTYDAARGHQPDSTARDFDALGLADNQGAFQVAGLEVPGSYKLWAFADLNANRSFEPASDLLVSVDTTFALTAERPRVTDVVLNIVNPKSPGEVSGTVVDSLPDSLGVIHVMAVAERDTSQQVLVVIDREGAFTLRLDAGPWQIRAFQDLDRNRRWDPERERASDRRTLVVEPASRTADFNLDIRTRRGGP
jgi:hypothetical protein